MKAAILAIGDELFAPGRIETNSVFLTDQLFVAGIPVGYRAVIGDDEFAIGGAVTQALDRAGVVFLTGGLGPTSDDVTRDAVARALSLEMHLDEEILAGLRRRFARRGIPMPEVNKRQAMVPEGATVLPNRRGTAPGLWVPTAGGKIVVLLPGPPAELEPMFTEHVALRLTATGAEVVYDILKLRVAGMPESLVEEKIAPCYRDVDNPSTTILASGGQIEIRLTAHGASAPEARSANERLADQLRMILGTAVFSDSEESLEGVVGRLLLESANASLSPSR